MIMVPVLFLPWMLFLVSAQDCPDSPPEASVLMQLQHERVAVNSDVMFLVRSWHHNYDTQVAAVLDTWAKDLNDSNLVIVGDEPSSSQSRIHAATDCGSDHEVGLLCRSIFGMAKALKQPGWKWLLVADDDLYVSPDRVAAKMQGKDSADLVAFGVVGCGSCGDFGGSATVAGFCGGAGYVMSRLAVERLLANGVDSTQREMVEKAVGYLYDDVCVACFLRSAGVKLSMLDNIYAWVLADEDAYREKIKNGALTFHYQNSSKLRRMHELFAEEHAEVPTLVQTLDRFEKYQLERKLFVEAWNAQANGSSHRTAGVAAF